MTAPDVLAITDDFQFCEAWGDLTPEQRHEIGSQGFDRIRKLRPISRRFKGNGDTPPDLDPVIEAQTSAVETVIPRPPHNIVQWLQLADREPPPFPWLLGHWLSWHPTLLAGRGGIGKSLLIQQLGTALSLGLPTWCDAAPPVRVLYWACEDDHDQLWRRQVKICQQAGIGMADLTSFFVDARYGLDNTLLSTEFGRPMWTPAIETLRQQVNDWQIDVLMLDNLGHIFGANENVRHDVTIFLNGIAGLVTGRPFCPIVLGHPSKAVGSEYSGSTAWENAVRMRWYLDDKLPDQHSDPDSKPDQDYRVLAKRKTNYTRMDYVQFRFNDGVLVPEKLEESAPGLMQNIRKRQSERIVVAAINKLAAVKIYGNNLSGRYYLPKLIVENKLAEGRSKAELGEAMRSLILEQKIEMSEIGRSAQRKIISGLIVK